MTELEAPCELRGQWGSPLQSLEVCLGSERRRTAERIFFFFLMGVSHVWASLTKTRDLSIVIWLHTHTQSMAWPSSVIRIFRNLNTYLNSNEASGSDGTKARSATHKPDRKTFQFHTSSVPKCPLPSPAARLVGHSPLHCFSRLQHNTIGCDTWAETSAFKGMNFTYDECFGDFIFRDWKPEDEKRKSHKTRDKSNL